TVPLTAFENNITVYSNAVTAALDGGKNAKSAREKAKRAVVKDLRQLAMYVESNCNDEMAIFTTSGFTARANASPSGPVGVPTFKSLDYGVHPGKSWCGSSPCREPRRTTCATARCRQRRRLRRARLPVRRLLRLPRRQEQRPGRRCRHGRC